MNRKLSVAVALGAVLSGNALVAEAQHRIPAVELGVYGGGAWSTKWLGINEEYNAFSGSGEEAAREGFGVGLNPMFGATASWFLTPAVGLRLHGAYMPSDFPTRDADADIAAFGRLGPAVVSVNALSDDETRYPLNNWLADLNLVLRPYAASRADWLGSTYFFVGGGVLTTDPAGDSDPGDVVTEESADCVDRYEALGACLSYNPKVGTVGQATAGFGLNLFPLSNRLGLFGELAVHAYDSPIHAPAEGDAQFASSLVEDRFSFTPRGVLGLKLSLGDLSPPVVVAPAPLPPTPAPAPAPAPEERSIGVCTVQGTGLATVNATFLPAEGDTVVMVNGQRRSFSEAYPAQAPSYAAESGWFLNNETVRLQDRQYVQFGVPRLITSTTQLTRVGEFQGVGVYAETGAAAPYPVLYVPLRPGCEFQPYQLREQIRVRG